ncbi:probable LRR receptor-like serine/threonine-protein kinase [Coccomyxa sp. Obi]|nr:probable LRR receptor-like serine/threonine-protein kinase [Coccomyxa sp. Obi]
MELLAGTCKCARSPSEISRAHPLIICLLVALLFIDTACQPDSSTLNSTSPEDVAALTAFRKAVSDPGGRLRTWQIGVDPCGSPNCTLGSSLSLPQGWHNNPTSSDVAALHQHNSTGMPVCNYFGVACQNWRVQKLMLTCGRSDSICAELQGTLPEDIANLTELTVLDLEHNQLRSQLSEALGRLSNLQVLRLGYNRFYGDVSPKWADMRYLRILDVRQNALTGVLPPAWGALENLESLLVDHNSLSGYLPPSFGSLHQLRVLSLGNTALVGALPTSWGNMTSLQALDVSDNCGICGNLPAFPPSVLAKLQVESQGSGLGWSCNRNTCAAFPISILAQAVICMSIVGGLVLLCLLRRVAYHYYPGLIILSPTAMYLHRQQRELARSQNTQELVQQTSNMEAGTALGSKRASAVFVNPDSTYSYAVREVEASSAEHSVRDQLEAEAARSGISPTAEASSAPGDQGAVTLQGTRTPTSSDASHLRAVGQR